MYFIFTLQCMCAVLCSVAQLCLTLCDLMDCSPPGSSVHGLESVAYPYSKGTSLPWNRTGISCIVDSWPAELPGKPACVLCASKSLPLCLTLCNTTTRWAHQMLSPWDSPGKNSGVDFYVFLQRISLTQGLNLCLFCLLHWHSGSLLLVPPGFQNLIKARQFPQRHWGFPGGSDSKESACNAGNWVQFIGWEDPLEKEMAPHSIILAWRIPWTEKYGRLQSVHGVPKSQAWLSN